MKKSPYMAQAEMQEFMWLSAMIQMCERILETTQEKEWRRRIKTINTLTNKVVEERIASFDPKELAKVQRRIKQLGIKVYSYDDAKVDHSDHGRQYTLSMDDFLDLLDGCTLNCQGCPQGDVVKECPRRLMFHRLGLQVHALRENPAPGECEFRYENEVYAISPQYKRIEKEVIHQCP